MIVIIMGPPGAGKGSQAEKIVNYYNIPHISTGNIFRENFKNNTAIGKLAKEYINKGELVPDKLTNEIVRERLLRKDTENGFLLDGYPRNLNQAQALDELIKRSGWKVDAVINLVVGEEALVKRITGRRVCPNCGAVYHVDNKRPQGDGICDNCATPLVQRADDTEETVKKRIEVYEESTQVLIDYYEKKHLLKNVDGDRDMNDIFSSIVQLLGVKSD